MLLFVDPQKRIVLYAHVESLIQAQRRFEIVNKPQAAAAGKLEDLRYTLKCNLHAHVVERARHQSAPQSKRLRSEHIEIPSSQKHIVAAIEIDPLLFRHI